MRIRLILKSLAQLEVLWRLAHDRRLNCCRIVEQNEFIVLDNLVDLSIAKPIPSTIRLIPGEVGGRHAVLTGPNGGGKSSCLRSILQAVLLGHTYGIVPAFAATMPRFHWIASGLQLRDTPGVLSMFETEVLFASQTLGINEGSGLVLFDELFHSTNPPDADRTAELFLHALWEKPGTFSVVSTHNFGLIERAPPCVSALCCDAKEDSSGEIHYSFMVSPGICKVSSVHTVWERFGLRAPTIEARGQPAAPNSSPSKRTEDAE